jgi:hypothetical protein
MAFPVSEISWKACFRLSPYYSLQYAAVLQLNSESQKSKFAFIQLGATLPIFAAILQGLEFAGIGFTHA